MIKGRFHQNVPNDIVEAYETIEQLMAHAFYHYPMYDVAIRELSALAEMAVKLRAKQKEIQLNYTDKNGKEKSRSLSNLIDLLLKEKEAKLLKDDLHRIRQFRNALVHRERNTFAGASFRHTIYPILNRVNELFYEDDWRTQDFNPLSKALKCFQEQCLILESNGLKFLAFLPQLNESIANKNLYLFSYEILYDQIKAETSPSESQIIVLSQLTVSENLIQATIVNGEKIKIYPTDKKENVDRYQAAMKRFKEDDETKRIYGSVKPISIASETDKFRYNNAWS